MIWKNTFPLNAACSSLNKIKLSLQDPEAVDLFQDILESGFYIRVKATGRSMWPIVKWGDIVILKKVKISSLKIGDLILFKTSQGNPILHRIVLILKTKTLFRTKGDALMVFDAPIEKGFVMGRVEKIEQISSKGSIRSITITSGPWKMINFVIALTSLFVGAVLRAFNWPIK